MKKLILLILISTLTNFAFSQCPALVGSDRDTVSCLSPCGSLKDSSNLKINSTSSYTVSSIPFSFYNTTSGISIPTTSDDIYSSVISLPFCFSYFGSNYNSLVIGSNGNISFNAALAGAVDPWSISGPLPGSNSNATKNAIMSPWCDIYPVSGGSIKYQVLGTAPCRKFVVSYNKLNMFLPGTYCTNDTETSQIVLYETTNIIEVFIAKHNSPSCTSWNGGRAVTGIENSTGTTFYCPPGENGTVFTAINEGWRFSPSGTVYPWSYNWTSSSGFTATGNSINVCPDLNISYSTYTVNATCTTSCGTITLSKIDTIYTKVINLTITGDTQVCQLDSILLTCSVPGGTWTTSNPLVAMVTNSGWVIGGNVGTTIIIYQVSGYCLGTFKVRVNPLAEKPTCAFINQICQGDISRVWLTNPNPTMVKYIWQYPGSSPVDTQYNSGPIFLQYFNIGTYPILVKSFNGMCWSDFYVDSIRVNPYPSAKILPVLTMYCLGDDVKLAPLYLEYNAYYDWEPTDYLRFENGKSDVTAHVSKELETIHCSVTSQWGCKSSDSILINAHSCCRVSIPSAFTPNGDGLNDKFGPTGTHFKILEFRVFNRWGQPIFSTSGFTMAHYMWDGTFNDVVQDAGVYYWMLTYTCDEETNETIMKGDVTLIR